MPMGSVATARVAHAPSPGCPAHSAAGWPTTACAPCCPTGQTAQVAHVWARVGRVAAPLLGSLLLAHPLLHAQQRQQASKAAAPQRQHRRLRWWQQCAAARTHQVGAQRNDCLSAVAAQRRASRSVRGAELLRRGRGRHGAAARAPRACEPVRGRGGCCPACPGAWGCTGKEEAAHAGALKLRKSCHGARDAKVLQSVESSTGICPAGTQQTAESPSGRQQQGPASSKGRSRRRGRCARPDPPQTKGDVRARACARHDDAGRRE